MKSIRNRILVNMIATVSISLILVGTTSIAISYNGAQTILKQTMLESAQITADRVAMEIKSYVTVAVETGMTAALTYDGTPLITKENLINQRASSYGFERGNIIRTDGVSIFDGNNYADREYFQESMAGKTCVSEPLLSKRTNQLAMIISAPLWKDGLPGTEVAGVVYFAPKASFLNDMTTKVKISPNSSAYIVDREGYTIAHKDATRVDQRENIEEMAKTNPALESLAAINTNMRAGKNDFESYTFDKVAKFSAYAPIAGSDGWSIALTAPVSDFMGATVQGILITTALLVFFLIATTFVAVKAAQFIGRPIQQCTDRLKRLAQGDLKTAVPRIISQDETGQLAEATQNIVNTLNDIIGDEDYLLSEMAKGNFNIQTKIEAKYTGDFNAILLSMRKINTGLSHTLSQINIASEQVSVGSEQVSGGAQALSQGTTEQASSVQELSSNIAEIALQVKFNAENADIASRQANQAGAELAKSNQKMQELMLAITEIRSSSQEIGKVIKTIEDIAFQTNILALNAAVEAARAGEAGKGFAVVADEVRNLASKSAESAKGTTQLIENSIKSVTNGTRFADDTAQSLLLVLHEAQQAAETINKISLASAEQASFIEQVKIGVEQISTVVQTNSATAEESAAASEELSGQANMMKDLVAKFKLKDSTEPLKVPVSMVESYDDTWTKHDSISKY